MAKHWDSFFEPLYITKLPLCLLIWSSILLCSHWMGRCCHWDDCFGIYIFSICMTVSLEYKISYRICFITVFKNLGTAGLEVCRPDIVFYRSHAIHLRIFQNVVSITRYCTLGNSNILECLCGLKFCKLQNFAKSNFASHHSDDLVPSTHHFKSQ